MMSKYSAKITVSAGSKTKAVFDSLNIDNNYYPENPTSTKLSLSGVITVRVESDQISHLRANLNSLLRLVWASYDSLQSSEQILPKQPTDA